MRRLFFAAAIFFSSLSLEAQIISPLGRELELSYHASFIMKDADQDPATAAQSHSDYLIGILKTQEMVESMGVNFEHVEGLGAPRQPLKITGLTTQKLDDGRTELSYNYRAKAIIHKTAAAKILRQGSFEAALPYDLENIFEKKCTDSHYNTEGDYWYFWDPYRKGCEKLLEEPYTRSVEVSAKAIEYKHLEENARFDFLRGDNGNGELMQIDLITGFSEAGGKRDEGWKIFKKLNAALVKRFGFEESSEGGSERNPLYTFEKTLDSGVKVQVRHLLVDTAIDSHSKAFAKFFRDSVANADVVVYSGHSGLGGNLDIPSLEEKAGKFTFDPKKRQLYYFNSCSSYTYYLDAFRAEKTKSRIDILTNALEAYMDDDSLDVQSLLESVLDESAPAPAWMDVLKKMEDAIPFDKSYLLNVGGV